MTAKITSGRFAVEKVQVNSENSKLKAFVIWYLRRTIFVGQILASDNIAPRDWKKKIAMLQKLVKVLPASERPKIHIANISIKNHHGIMDFACKTISATANANNKTITTRFRRRLKLNIK
jgi:hypothetical protein